ncbi:MAG: HelD family protein [Acidimicrobiales bacterium]
MAPDRDLDTEQACMDRAYRRLAQMRAAAGEMLEQALASDRGGTHQARRERDVIVGASLARREQLELGSRALVFGRIDLAPVQPEDASAGPSYHIGRLGVLGEDLEPIIVDWRAPVAEPFYRATGRHPMGLTRRRHLEMEGPRVVGIEDELFALARPGAGGPGGTDSDLPVPSGALLAALERSRSGRMRDIVATVQREQDEVIRAPLPGVLVVQGGPGTGKTAVALHRAAYLLYTHRFPLERQGVLVVGPNQVFLRYISQVLPSLGETGVALSSVDGLVAGASARAGEGASLARLKGDARMMSVIAKAVADRERPLREELVLPFGALTLRLPAAQSARIVAAARRGRGRHNSRRQLVETLVTEHLLAGQLAAGRQLGRPSPEEALDEEALRESLRSHPEVVAACDRMWPRLLAEELLHDLFGAPALLGLACAPFLSAAEARTLRRARSSSLEAIPWTAADLPLLDEARALLGPVRGHPSSEAPRTYGHIVVDEAQELSAMSLRCLQRRSLSGSMTVVGDIAQATGPHAPTSWDAVTTHLARRRPPTTVQLTVNYRTPAAIMDVATRLLEQAAPGLRPPRSIRSGGDPPSVVGVEAPALAVTAAALARAERASLASGTVGVICPEVLLAEVRAALGPPAGDAARPASTAPGAGARSGPLDDPVAVVPVSLAKGLELDAVIVVEPRALVAEAEGGLRALYVALTRSTRRLLIVHAAPLPAALERALGSPAGG